MAVRKFAQNLLELGSERLKRAKEQGFDTDQTWYHGSTHNIKEMGGDTINPESHFGAGYYLTSSADDASKNYAGVGPDLTQRIQLRAEQIAGAEDLDYDDPGVLARAEAELKGDSDGVIYPAYTRTKKTFDISSDGDTFLEYKQPDLDPEDYLDEADGDMDLAEELARDDSYNFEPEGDLVDFIESLRYDERIEHGKDELIGAILDESYDGGISGKRLDEIMRNTDFFANDFDTGDLVNNEVYRTALEEAGFDSVVHDGDIFKGMDIEPGTKHKIIFAPENIRSVNAEFDPEKTDSKNLLASPVPVTMGAGLLSAQAIPTVKDKAVAVGETLLDAGQAMIAPIAAAPHALIPALLSDKPTAQIEQGYQNLLQQQNYEPRTQLGQQYSQAAQQFMGDAFDAAAQSAPGQAIKQVVEPINLLIQQAPDRARLIGRSLLDMSPF